MKSASLRRVAKNLLRAMAALEIVGIGRDVRVADRPADGSGLWLLVGIVRIGLVELELFQMLLKILVRLFQHRRAQLSPLKLVDGRQQQTALGRELLSGVGPAARIGHRRNIVRPEMPLDELSCRTGRRAAFEGG